MLAAEVHGAAPVACTLGAADMGPRLARIRQLTRAHLLASRLEGATLCLSYKPDAAADVAAIVELERQCCGFLEFRLTLGADAVDLLIVGPPQQATDAQWLFSRFLPEPSPGEAVANCGVSPTLSSQT